MHDKDSTQYHNNRQHFSDKIYESDVMMPFRYVFILTNKCNLKCSFCFQERRKQPDSFILKDWVNVVKQLPEYAWVTLTGGEPLSFKDFDNIFHEVATNHECNIISNGLLLNSKKIDYLLSYKKFKILSISIDDIGNRNRDVTKEQWDKLVVDLKYFVSRNRALNLDKILDVKTIILDSNAHEIFNIYKYVVEELGVNTHSFQLLKGSPIQFSDKSFEFEDIFKEYYAPVYKKPKLIVEQLNMVREYNLLHNKQSYIHPKVINLCSSDQINIAEFDQVNVTNFNSEKFEPCRTPWESVHINVNGSVFPCMAVSMGNLKQEKLEEIIFAKSFTKFKSVIRHNGTVNGCNRCGYVKFL